MVKLSILSYKGNANTRFYPHSGYLGLTPVKVDGGTRSLTHSSPVQGRVALSFRALIIPHLASSLFYVL